MNPPDFNNDHTIICVELLEVTLTHQQLKLTLKIKLENLLLYQKYLRNLVGRALHLLGKESIVW